MNKKIYIKVVLGALILGGALYYLFGGEPSPSATTPPAASSQSDARLTFAGSSIVEEEDGKKIWELSADTIETDQAGKTVYLNNLKGTFYQKTGSTITVIAQKAVLDRDTRDLSMQGDIKVTTSDGAVFTAPEARWSGEPKSFTGTGGITMTRNGTKITGDNITTDANIEKIRVYGNARVLTGGKSE